MHYNLSGRNCNGAGLIAGCQVLLSQVNSVGTASARKKRNRRVFRIALQCDLTRMLSIIVTLVLPVRQLKHMFSFMTYIVTAKGANPYPMQ